MIRPLLALLVVAALIHNQPVDALQCWEGHRLTIYMYGILYPPNPVLTTCPPEARCCKKTRIQQPWIKYCCTADCPEFKGKESVTETMNNGDYITHCTGPNGTCVWNNGIGYGQDQYPNNKWPANEPHPPTCS